MVANQYQPRTQQPQAAPKSTPISAQPMQTQANAQPQTNFSKDELIGYHKGALSTLLGERNELLKMVSTVEQFIQAHAQELEKLGVKIAQEQQK